MIKNSEYPEYLSSLEALQQHFRAQLEGLSNTEKGQRFAQFVQKLVPQSDAGSNFDLPTLNEKISGDGGVDLFAESKIDDRRLHIQSKLWVDRADAIDSIMSKFQAYTTPSQAPQSLFEQPEPKNHFLLVTLSPLAGVIKGYEKKQYASRAFYDQCVREHRFTFLDGPQIFQTLRTAYSKLNHIPGTLTLNFATPYIKSGNVYIGILSSEELKSLYAACGDALFFANVRDFLGPQRVVEKVGRTTPNNEIIKTINTAPDQLLSRNNGIVFGVEKVEPGATPNQLILMNGSVVNGCQTTMCIVEYAEKPSFVLAKVVQTDDAWDITKSANYQTSVPDIDLELAQFLRPQLVKRAAGHLGVKIKDVESSAFQVVDEIYDHKVAYNETRLLYIGLFSRSPNNVFASNYTELIKEPIQQIYQESSYEEDVFETLFLLQRASQLGLKKAKSIFKHPQYAGLFDRLFKDETLPYRCFLSILALCGAVNINIADRLDDTNKEYERVKNFLAQARDVLKNQPDEYSKFYRLSVKVWMQDILTNEEESEVRRDMFIRTKRMQFATMFRKLCIEADLDAARGT